MKIKKNVKGATQGVLVTFDNGEDIIASDNGVKLEVGRRVTQIGNFRAALKSPIPKKAWGNDTSVAYTIPAYKKYIADRKKPHKYYGNIISDAAKAGMPLRVSFVNIPNNKIVAKDKNEIFFKQKGKSNKGF